MGPKPRKPATPPEPSSPPNELELPNAGVSSATLNWSCACCGAKRSTRSRARARCRPMSWRAGTVFLEQGTRGLKTGSDPDERELRLARAKIGELMMRLELAEHLTEKRGFTDECKKPQR